jgi:ATP-binding cassette subfamily E protein 1
MLTDASVYFFDEPSSYLDIFERLRVAKAIKELAEDGDGRRVVIVEHDLALLDFLADDVHILYGTEGTYGIVTHARPVKAAVNTYLSGFLREENVRFRDTEVRFEARPPRSEWKTATLVQFPALKKRLGDFDFEVNRGGIKVGEVVGIVGPNAVGKTTFVKMLAGAIEPDEGKLDSESATSYKPQYISGEFEGTVEALLRLELQQTFDSSYFEREVMHPLNLKVLLNRDVPTLSGGELQRVAICLCLGREADIYLIDEPSAYLDSNQRVIAAKVIRRVMEFRGKSALIVDHDVYFIDLVCDSLMVFGGEPSRHGVGRGPFSMHEGMNQFLGTVDVTFRRDNETKRPRINKPGSVKDREQKAAGEYYYLVGG